MNIGSFNLDLTTPARIGRCVVTFNVLKTVACITETNVIPISETSHYFTPSTHIAVRWKEHQWTASNSITLLSISIKIRQLVQKSSAASQGNLPHRYDNDVRYKPLTNQEKQTMNKLGKARTA
jgi:hypothetical protein